jgi:hypothetical protein
MKIERLVALTIETLTEGGQKIRTERGNFRGGFCVIDEIPQIVLNKRHSPEIHFAILAREIKNLGLTNFPFKPAVRAALESAWERQFDATEKMTELDAD